MNKEIFNNKIKSMQNYIMFEIKARQIELTPTLKAKNRAPIALSMGAPVERVPEFAIKKATEYLNEIVYTGGFYCLSPKNLKKASDIVTEYIEKVNTKKLSQEEREEYGFPSGFDMVLTREKILENKDFFNTLFKKYKVDYQIKDPQ